MTKIDYKLKNERLIRTTQLFKDLDNLPQLEKGPEIYSTNQETKKELDQILGKLYQLEPIFEDSGKYALYRNTSSFENLKNALTKAGLLHNKKEAYGTPDKESFVEIENFTGIENVSLNVFVKYEPKYNELGLFEGHVPTESILELVVLN